MQHLAMDYGIAKVVVGEIQTVLGEEELLLTFAQQPSNQRPGLSKLAGK